ncbi:PepSY-associated TM helix domain-containing protein [Brevibacterium casei]|uniref:PepSY domain-containing protein n=1 Tax=Brevibacterium casei TaxID=33889 RepID=A0A165EI92_9MICO|nr:PepSY-associated TM helix domain-containing protein [Brevibacterium casei]KZE24468.1 peptidase [Brevibacterium casei]QPS34680.1 PepSY domain-containing protein [Brevibacterium casei]
MTSPSSSLPERSGADADASAQSSSDSVPARRILVRDQPAQAAAKRSGWFSALLRRLHFYAGIFIGPFIFTAAVTGALYALSPQLEKLIYADELYANSTGPALPLADQVAAAEAFTGGTETLKAVLPAPEPGATTRVLYDDPTLGENESRAIFIDPATAEVQGDLTSFSSEGALPLRKWIDQLHINLNLGAPGEFYSELAASCLGVVVVVGLILWFMRAKTTKKLSTMLRPSNKRKGLRRTFSWHASVGVWAAIGMLFLSATGITWSQLAGANVDKVREALGWGSPSLSRELDSSAAESGDSGGGHEGHGASGDSAAAPAAKPAPEDFDMILGMAQKVNVNTSIVEINPPTDANTAWRVRELQRSVPSEVDSVAIDPNTMEIVDRLDFEDYSIPAKLTHWGIFFHMGMLFGLANQIGLFVLAVGIAAMVVWGYVMWWQRRPKHDPSRRFGVAPARGAIARAPWWGIASVVVVGAAVAWFLPLVGLSLVVFLAVDVLLGLRARRKTRAAAADSESERVRA